MLDYCDYNTGDNGYQGNGNGYQGLSGDWALYYLYYKVAKRFVRKVKPEDREDFLHDLLIEMAKVRAGYEVKGKLLTEAGLMRVASYRVANYWRRYFKRVNGVDCGRCSRQQREKCRDWYLYPDCPKAVKIESLDRLVEDGNGDSTPLSELIADDNAVDVVARLDARFTLQGYPHKFVRIAYKQYVGYPLTNAERNYLYRQNKKSQKRMILA